VKKELILGIATTVFLSTSIIAGTDVPYKLSEFEAKGLGSEVGVVNRNGNSFLKAGLSPNFEWGVLSVGFDINAYVPTQKGDSSQFNVVFRNIGFDYQKKYGAKWGHLKNVTLGQGLLIDRYDSGSGGDSTEFTPDKAGVLGYATASNVRIDGFWTASKIAAGRISYEMEDTALMGSSVIVGGTYIKDSDGSGTSTTAVSGYSADIAAPIGGDFLTVYSEYAQLENNGKGGSVGVKGEILDYSYRLEYRKFGSHFIPGYFNYNYELAPGNLATVNQEFNGILGAAGTSLFNGYIKTGLKYESYGDVNLLSASLGWKEIANYTGVINYTKPFKSNTDAIADAEILYRTGGVMDYVFNMRRVYQPTSTYDTWTVATRINLSRLFPGL